jgi:hypothetical protein
MYAVALVQFGDAADVFEEKRDERRAVFLRQPGVHLPEFGGVALTHVGRGFHPGEDDFGLGVFGFHRFDDGAQVFVGRSRFDSTEGVVAAEFQHKNINGLAQHPVDSFPAAGGRFTAQPGVMAL